MKTAILLLSCAMAAAPVAARADECPDLFKMLGLITRSSLICNWPERPSMEKVSAMIGGSATCKMVSKSDAEVYVGLGMRDFDQEAQSTGEKRACSDTDHFLSALDGR